MQKIATLALCLVAALPAFATVRFVSPLEGAQAIGPQVIEIAADTSEVSRVDFYVDGVLAGVARTAPHRIAFDFGSALTARTITARVWSAGFRSSETATVTTAALTANDTLDVDLVEVPLRVRSTRALRASDLRLRENGVEQEVRDVKRERPAAHFAFIVDRSLSMTDGKLDAALEAIETELGQLRQGDTASLVLFNHVVSKARPISRGQSLRAGASVPSGGTSLRDALASVATTDRTYAIVITDGGDRNSELSDEVALRRISGTKTVVHAIVLGSSHTSFLDRSAKNTGGSVASATKASIRTTLSRILEDINSRYLVIYQSHGTKRGWRTIDIRARARGVSVVSARKGYFAE